MDINSLEQWCKWLEKNFSFEIMIPKLPVIIRLDGNNFSEWTRKLNKPFDENFSKLMIDSTKFLVKETNAIVGYTQSDEIILILYSDSIKSAIYNDGKKQKILSKLTGKLSGYFNDIKLKYLPNNLNLANFDCRIYQTPTLNDACIQLLWRENDATRNSKLMLANSLFGHAKCLNLNTSELQDKMMLEKGVNWNNLENKYKRGTYIKRIKVNKPFSKEEIDSLPLKHNARKNPDLIIERNVFKEMDYPIFNKISNKVDVIFNDQEPILKYYQ
jgi:tRNA(His) 5'-end guanylyltransferase